MKVKINVVKESLVHRDSDWAGGYVRASNDDSTCPTDIEHKWEYIDNNHEWHDAGKGVIIRCVKKEESGRLA